MGNFHGGVDAEIFLAELRELREVNCIRINGMSGAAFLRAEIVQEFFSLHEIKDEWISPKTEKTALVLWTEECY